MKEYTDAEMFDIFQGHEQATIEEYEKIADKAPMCHFRKMFLDESDSTDGYIDKWWECSVCGHTKDV